MGKTSKGRFSHSIKERVARAVLDYQFFNYLSEYCGGIDFRKILTTDSSKHRVCSEYNSYCEHWTYDSVASHNNSQERYVLIRQAPTWTFLTKSDFCA